MKNIKILGSGCAKCSRTETLVKDTISQLGVEAKVEKVEDIMEIMKYDILSTPALVVDEKVVIKGRVPTADEIKAIFS